MNKAKVTKYYVAGVWVCVSMLALVSRFFEIDNKPLHFDEGINGWFVMQMKNLGFYRYDPNNYHGPLYFYILHWFESLWGVSVHTLRAVPAVFSVLSVMLMAFPILKDRRALYITTVFFLLSPAFIFYGRSGIHEMPFVFFQLLFVLGLLRWFENKDSKALGLTLVGVLGMAALKETFLITGFAAFLGILSLGFQKFKQTLSPRAVKQAWTQGLSIVLGCSFFVFIAVYSGSFKNFAGLADFFKALAPWLKTGVHGNGHEKEFFYWIEVLWTAEPLVLAGVLVSVFGIFSSQASLRFMSVFSLVQLLVYSLIPYKTVWCIISLVWGFYVVLAMFLANLRLRSLKGLLPVAATLFCGVVLGLQSIYESSYKTPINMDHPYVYVNSTYDLKFIERTLRKKMYDHPELKAEAIQIGMQEQWPWPWLLQDGKITSYDVCQKKLVEDAWIYFCDPEAQAVVEEHLKGKYWKMRVALRQARGDSIIYFRKDRFTEDEFPGQLTEVR